MILTSTAACTYVVTPNSSLSPQVLIIQALASCEVQRGAISVRLTCLKHDISGKYAAHILDFADFIFSICRVQLLFSFISRFIILKIQSSSVVVTTIEAQGERSVESTAVSTLTISQFARQADNNANRTGKKSRSVHRCMSLTVFCIPV
jgi:hypothetical protein